MGAKVIFTTCTASYLAQAKSLGDSLRLTNPGYKLCIGLVDKINNRLDPGFFLPHEIAEVGAIGVPVFDDMKKRYSLLELSCALKPWFALHFLKKLSLQQIIYLDTDIRIYSSLQLLEDQLEQYSILLTPHLLSPLPQDGKQPHETTVLKTGIFNAGFFAVKNDAEGNKFLNWWKDILVDYCYEDGKRCLASDQTWLNFVPAFFQGVAILRHSGCNVAYWNLHERSVEKKNGSYFVNNNSPLLFFHFSGYSTQHPDKISKHQDRFTMDENPVVKELFQQYHEALIANKHSEFQKIPCVYKKPEGLLSRLRLKK